MLAVLWAWPCSWVSAAVVVLLMAPGQHGETPG